MPQETVAPTVDILDGPHEVIEGNLELDEEELAGSIIHLVPLNGEQSPLVVREVALQPEMDQPNEGTIVLMHGLTQLSDAGPSAALQEHLALMHPNRRVLAIESDNMGAYSAGLSLRDFREFADYTLERMAERRLQFMQGIEGPITLVGTSMGTVLTAKLLRSAQQAAHEDDSLINLDIDSIIFNDSAIVVDDRQSKMRGFLPHLVTAAGLELWRIPKGRLVDAVRLGSHALGAVGSKDLIAMARQIYDIYLGDHPTEEDLHAMVKALDPRTQLIFISGITDPLRTPKVYKALKLVYPDQVHVKKVGYASHARSIDPLRVAYDITAALEKDVSRYAPHVHTTIR